MYNVFLLVSMVVVVISPVFIDLLISLQERRFERPHPVQNEEGGPNGTWASSLQR